jgi:membrane-associated phospholipid phosphatase
VKYKREIRANVAARWWFLISAGAVVLLLASFYLDAGAQAWMEHNQIPGVRRFMEIVSLFGDWPGHIALGLVLVGIAYLLGNKNWMRIFAVMILACAVAGVAARVVKISTGRARPNVETETRWTGGPQFSPRYNAFPSGHTAASTAFFATLALASRRLGLGLLLIPTLVAFSRMYVGAHHLSDVVAAALIGVSAAYFVARRMFPKSERRELEI